MIYYEKAVQKSYKKGEIPERIMQLFHNAFLSIEGTEDMDLFDIKRIKGSYDRTYYRLRKSKFRALFYFSEKDIYVIYIGKRDEVYKKWE
jgi:mRNA interferase RelE/StbE